MQMTEQQYLYEDATRCPNCGSTQLERGPIVAEGTAAARVVRCACGREWSDLFTMIGVMGLTPVDEDEAEACLEMES